MLKQVVGDVLDIRTLAGYLNIAPVTVYRLLQKKDDNGFPGHKVKGQWRFFKVDVDQWVRTNR